MGRLGLVIESMTPKDLYKCTVALIRDKLDKDDRDSLDNAIAIGVPSRILVRALQAEGYKIGNPTMNDHRGQRCKCFPEKGRGNWAD